MQILSDTRYPTLGEFSPEERIHWFSLKAHAVLPHIDTLYYSVSIEGDSNENDAAGLRTLIGELSRLKKRKMTSPGETVLFCDLEVMPTGYAIYEFQLRLNETYDIFIGRYLPNPDTPRVVVQLRSRSLVLDGVSEAILRSFDRVKVILHSFGLEVGSVRENRIDYAYHTNLIQNPYRFFSDDRLLRHLRTNFGIGQKVFRFGKDIRLDYFALGQKKSNAIFFRCYNKSQEVVEKNYKPFFIDRWLANGLISEYDAYVYRTAYELHSYRTGVLVGRMRWYLEHGKNAEMRRRFEQDLATAYENSDNNDFLEKEVNAVLPPVTLILNVEFQTKRRFYASVGEQYLSAIDYRYNGEAVLERLMKLVSLSPEFLDYLTRETVCFVADREDAEGKGKDRVLCDWWRRIHGCRIPFTDKLTLDLWREYDRKTDLRRARSQVQSAIARFNILSRQSLDPHTFAEDVSDTLCALNDNDFYGFASDEQGRPTILSSYGYDSIRRRKARQYRGVIKEKETPEEKDATKGDFSGKSPLDSPNLFNA